MHCDVNSMHNSYQIWLKIIKNLTSLCLLFFHFDCEFLYFYFVASSCIEFFCYFLSHAYVEPMWTQKDCKSLFFIKIKSIWFVEKLTRKPAFSPSQFFYTFSIFSVLYFFYIFSTPRNRSTASFASALYQSGNPASFNSSGR